MELLKAPNQSLRTKTKPVKKITAELLGLVKEMIKLASSFTDPEGVGLSANQVGRTERLCVVKLKDEFKPFFNIKVTSEAKKSKVYFEGCLSVPDIWGEVKRPIGVSIEYQNEAGKLIKKRLQGISSWIVQHEIDHLNGVLFIDRVLQQKGRVFKVEGKDKAGNEVFEEINMKL